MGLCSSVERKFIFFGPPLVREGEMKLVRKGDEELGWWGGGGGSRNTLGCSGNYFCVFIDLNLYFLPARADRGRVPEFISKYYELIINYR